MSGWSRCVVRASVKQIGDKNKSGLLEREATTNSDDSPGHKPKKSSKNHGAFQGCIDRLKKKWNAKNTQKKKKVTPQSSFSSPSNLHTQSPHPIHSYDFPLPSFVLDAPLPSSPFSRHSFHIRRSRSACTFLSPLHCS